MATKKPKTLKVGCLIRGMQVESCEIRKAEDGTKRFSLSLSSEFEVDRGWGMKEVLSHDKAAIRLDRATSGAMPLLFNHNWDDPVGMVDKASIKNKRLNVEGNFFNTQRAQDVASMVESGLRNVSVGYRINKIEEDCEHDLYTITDWEPYEASIAPVPADPSVGSGRAMTRDADADIREISIGTRSLETPAPSHDPPTENPPITEPKEARNTRASSSLSPPTLGTGATMSDTNAAAGASAGNQNQNGAAAGDDATRNANAGGGRATAAAGPSAQDMENARVTAITNMCKACNMDDGLKQRWITGGTSFTDVSDQVMRIIEQRAKSNPEKNSAFLDLSPGDTQRFSIVRAINAVVEKDWRKAGFEAECSGEIAKRLNTVPDAMKFFVPYDVQRRGIDPRAINSQQRALNTPGVAMPYGTRADIAGTATLGGYLVQTTNVGFIELLRNRAVAYRMGATQLSGLVGNVNVPKQTAAGTAFWLASETTQATEVEQTFGQMALSPHTVGAYTEISRLLLLQSSPDVEGIVNADLAAVAALAIDKGALSGSGTAGQPTGIANVSGVGVISGAAITAITYPGQLQYQVAVANANVMPSRAGYATTPTIAALMMGKTRFANTNTPLWDGNLWDANGVGGVAGFPGMSSNQIPSQNIFFGDWNSVVVAEWGVLEIEVNPYANFQAGIIGIRAMMTIDIGLRYPAAFAVSTTTTS